MNAANDIQGAMAVANAAPVMVPQRTGNPAVARHAAQEFEGVFLSQFLGAMFEGLSTDGPFGGGQGEQMFRSMMLDQYGKQIVAQGGIGIADSVTRELLKTQEVRQ